MSDRPLADNLYTGKQPPETIPLRWSTIVSIWWSFFWRATLIGMLLGFIIGAVAGAILGAMGRQDLIAPIAQLAGFVGGIPAGIISMKLMLDKRLPDLLAAAGAVIRPPAQSTEAIDDFV